MATVIRFGSLCLDDSRIDIGSNYSSGKEIAITPGNEISWVLTNGCFVADQCLLVDISWDELNAQDLVFGKEITVGNRRFRIRSLKVGHEDEGSNEWDAALTDVGDDNNIWHWDKIFFWGQEACYGMPSSHAYRGYMSARFRAWGTSHIKRANLGFRPVLEPLSSTKLSFGNTVCVVHGQSILYGQLLDLTSYDIFLRTSPASILEDESEGNWTRRLSDGALIIDRAKTVIQKI